MPDSNGPARLSRRGFFRALTGTLDSPPKEVLPPQPGRKPASRPMTLTHDRPLITLNGQFFRQTYRPGTEAPEIDLGTWRLAVGGLVETPLFLSLTQLWTLPSALDTCTLMCIGNVPGGDQIGNATWRGVRLADLLARTGVRAEATHLCFESADGYTTGLPLTEVADAGVLLAYEMNGGRLPREHGYPLRVVFPGRYGLKSPKWLKAITLVDYEPVGTWERAPHGWSASGLVKTWSRIDTPVSQSEVQVGEPVALQGVAYAGERAIRAVEVSVDGGTWMPVTIRPAVSRHAWTQWYTHWTPEQPGDVSICVRATDESGFVQSRMPGPDSGAYPDGTDAIHAIVVRARE